MVCAVQMDHRGIGGVPCVGWAALLGPHPDVGPLRLYDRTPSTPASRVHRVSCDDGPVPHVYPHAAMHATAEARTTSRPMTRPWERRTGEAGDARAAPAAAERGAACRMTVVTPCASRARPFTGGCGIRHVGSGALLMEVRHVSTFLDGDAQWCCAGEPPLAAEAACGRGKCPCVFNQAMRRPAYPC